MIINTPMYTYIDYILQICKECIIQFLNGVGEWVDKVDFGDLSEGTKERAESMRMHERGVWTRRRRQKKENKRPRGGHPPYEYSR